MMRWLFLLISILSIGCVPRNNYGQKIQQSYDLSENQEIRIQIDHGTVTVYGGNWDKFVVTGIISSAEVSTFQVNEDSDWLEIVAQTQHQLFRRRVHSPVDFVLQVPDGQIMKIESNGADVRIVDFKGAVEISSVSGDIQVENFKGKISLRSSRGGITLNRVSGELSITGDHGVLSLENVEGDIGVSTIMGEINYVGRIDTDHRIRLEADHGPVRVFLNPNSNFQATVNSNSGNITCLPPALLYSSRGCSGTLGSGAGSLVVRTVSGDVILSIMP